jgi:hypothetical protein
VLLQRCILLLPAVAATAKVLRPLRKPCGQPPPLLLRLLLLQLLLLLQRCLRLLLPLLPLCVCVVS